MESASTSALRSKASKLLKAVADKVNSPRLTTLALQIRLDAFTRVKEAIDEMIAQLLKEKADEIKHKDFCVEEFNANLHQTEKKEIVAKIEDLTRTIDTLTKEIEMLKAEILEM